jgi:hypothetical protein
LAIGDRRDLSRGGTVHFSDVPFEPVAFVGEVAVEVGFSGVGGGGLYELAGGLVALCSSTTISGFSFATPYSVFVAMIPYRQSSAAARRGERLPLVPLLLWRWWRIRVS